MNKKDIFEQFKVTRILYSALIAGQISFFVVALIIVENKLVEPIQSLNELFIYLIPIIGFIAMTLSHRIYLNNVTNFEKDKEPAAKYLVYRKFKIIQWTLIEAASFFSLGGFIITENYLYSIIFLFLVGFFVLVRPTLEQFKVDFGISDK